MTKLLLAYFLGVLHSAGIYGTVISQRTVYPVIAVASALVMLGMIIKELYKRK